MYNAKQLQFFINKVKAEAEKEAQKVFDKYNDELVIRIKNQLKHGDTIFTANGTCLIDNKQGDSIADEMSNVVGNTQYWKDNVSAGFSVPYKMSKYGIIEE